MKITLVKRDYYTVLADGRDVGDYVMAGREWNGMMDLRSVDDTCGSFVVNVPDRLSRAFDFGRGVDVAVVSLSEMARKRLEKVAAAATPADIEYASWMADLQGAAA